MNDTIKVSEWRKSVVVLFQKLPQYNKNDFSFEITVGHKIHPKHENYYFVEKGKYCNVFYDWREVYKKYTKNVEEAVYWILNELVSKYAYKYEKEHRVRYTDTRRLWMSLEQEMFDIIGQPYSDKKRNELAEILRQAPFDDLATCKLDLVEDYEEIARLLKVTSYYSTSDICKKNVDRLLTAYRTQTGIHDFENAFVKMKNEIQEIYSFLSAQQDKVEIEEILRHIEFSQEIAKRYLAT